MEITLSRLEPKDVAKLKELNMLFGTVFKDAHNYMNHRPSNDYLSEFLADKNNIAIIAESGGQLIGGLVAYTLIKFEQERKEVYLYDLAVAETAQRQGVGRRLVDELKRVAESVGAYVVFVQADEGDDAIYFYESLQPSENLKTRSFDFNMD